VGVRVDLDRLPESEPELAEVEDVQVLVALMQPEDARICSNNSKNIMGKECTRLDDGRLGSVQRTDPGVQALGLRPRHILVA